MAVAGSVGFGPRAGSLRGGVIGPGARIPWRYVTSNSVRRGGVSRLVGVTKPFPRRGWRFWHRNYAIWVRYRDVIPCDDRGIVLRESESKETPPGLWLCRAARAPALMCPGVPRYWTHRDGCCGSKIGWVGVAIEKGGRRRCSVQRASGAL